MFVESVLLRAALMLSQGELERPRRLSRRLSRAEIEDFLAGRNRTNANRDFTE